ncbi:MAG: hypothetical protein A3G52_00680 [Candidatus Taylorbacteria bacterium RIFCSPLOWO2_12_FULL_43_20]|uniref:Polymerase beta nucleotidyltransferase domain-containing protein n=1 Tax=Candidatus Taylorbacteria bacterium RIFCSPLOWO2_12_FULL_43_20 TaxID=1802332 RepID=A0A1G2NZT1_9BACT|nr:MAG: hypothetical protein A3B98_01145 [Candidatus Taylorbacteria bacterium RIFCSPHIGHO2_02_FULL_43_55]OHA29595.1 MAG: hypothetical protein A3E92_04035 [Candidatus Taylorbacteria bacterium RIFCSPHIGHO2_12_FULL_42_34]OHA37580.1 MAG: hypothetical protein A3H58_02040 [Candidatus Taylorbacteria bacterium RIFCSPLOWO2_02_FULL_43_22b]OHA41607.1 MAG: hypothetical protein A3G52_00680 [Candidatus Taylorbacteria bacterium RIFCSPLOWO2_12_FULL_43_20]
MIITDDIKQRIADLAQKYGLDLVVLFGSQATGRTHPKSDVDIGYLSDQALDYQKEFAIQEDLFRLFRRTDVELVNLSRISPVMKKLVSDEGVVLYEREPGLFARFSMYAFKLFVETKKIRELRYQSLKDFIYAGNK